MTALSKTISKITTRQRSRARNIRRQVDNVRKAITIKSRRWEGTRIIRETRDAR